jgi:hypothetical protein
MKTDNGGTPWTSDAVAAPLDGPSSPTVVVATRFVVRRRRDTVPFLRAALASAREAEAVPGFLGAPCWLTCGTGGSGP